MTPVHFSLVHWCVLVVALLPIVCAGIAKAGSFRTPRSQGGYDNGDPRAWLARQTDWRARANAAQANSFEALPFFIGAVVLAQQLGARQSLLDILAFVFVVLRVVYILLYVGGQATARSLVWTLALAVNVAILFAGYH
ncbi:MAG: MAPEG family protein [Rhodoferax sp.]|nr:MAPEG family protein [Rhodoferax sp.]